MMTSSKWKHFPRYWPFVRGIHRFPMNSPHKDQWRGTLIWARINGWVTDGEAGDLRCHRSHYYVIVMFYLRHTHSRMCMYIKCWQDDLVYFSYPFCILIRLLESHSTSRSLSVYPNLFFQHFHIVVSTYIEYRFAMQDICILRTQWQFVHIFMSFYAVTS